MPGDGEVTYPSETGQALIPYQVTEETYDYYEVRNYVNDINQDYTQVLTGYDEKGRIRESYTYGVTGGSANDGSAAGSGTAIGGRLDYSDGKNTWYYGYTGIGSVAQLTDQKGTLAATYSYDAFGNTSVQDYIGNITGNRNITGNYTLNPYTYNAEYTDASTGNQYLRARYYSPETGNFFTEDSYLGSLLEPLERNLYTYAENDPVNYQDPSGHGIVNKIKQGWNKAKSTARKVWNKVKSTVSKKWSTVKTTVSSIYNKAKEGLNNYMNSDSYTSYFSDSGMPSRGASTGNGYVGRKSDGDSEEGISGYTSYSYVKYNRNSPYKLNIGGTTIYYETKAEMETAKKFCKDADTIQKDELPDTVKNEDLLKVVATGLILVGVGTAATVATGGTAILLPGLVGTIVGGASGGLGNFLSGGNVLDGILSGMVNGAVTGLVSGLIPGVGGNVIANLAGGTVGGIYNAFLGGDNSVKTAVSSEVSAVAQMITSGPWGSFVGKTVPITNAVDAVGSGIASWIGETGFITTDRVTHILLGM